MQFKYISMVPRNSHVGMCFLFHLGQNFLMFTYMPEPTMLPEDIKKFHLWVLKESKRVHRHQKHIEKKITYNITGIYRKYLLQILKCSVVGDITKVKNHWVTQLIQ